MYFYRGPCILRPSIQPENYGLKLKVVLNMLKREIFKLKMPGCGYG